MPGISFTAIDLATANSDRASVCGVGLAKVQDGRLVDKTSWLIKPPPGLGHFDPVNTEVHGIRAEDVASAADWEMSIEGILHFTCEDPLVAYNAAYNAEVLLKASGRLNLDLPAKNFYCALELAQNELHLPRRSLTHTLAALKLPPVAQTEPGANAVACSKIVLAIARMRKMGRFEEIWKEPAVTVGRKPQGRRRKQSSE